MIFSAHLPPARGKTEQFLKLIETLPASIPFVTPHQAALEQIMSEMKSGSQPASDAAESWQNPIGRPMIFELFAEASRKNNLLEVIGYVQH